MNALFYTLGPVKCLFYALKKAGSLGTDCGNKRPAAKQAGCNVTLTVQEDTRHQFPAQPYHV